MRKLSILVEFWEFLRYRKKYWLIPILVTLLFLFALIWLSYSFPVMAPFIYTVF